MPHFRNEQSVFLFDLFDDRRRIWNRDGKLPVARRRAHLRAETARLGILSYGSEQTQAKLGQCTLADLRRIHTYAAGGVYGSVNLRRERTDGKGRLTDPFDSSYSAPIRPGDHTLDMDFRPYNVHHKIDRLATAATYFFFEDAGSTIDALNDARRAEQELPDVLIGSTNRTFAKLLVKKTDLRLYGARVEADGRVFEFGGQKAADILQGHEDKTLKEASASVELHLFTRTEDFLGDENRQLYAGYAASLRDRLAAPGETPDETEARLRAEAIAMCLQTMRPTDIFRLSRYAYRRDLRNPTIVSDSPQTESLWEIASWQPQVGIRDFVPANYYYNA